jgi:hypothetical protein
MISDSPCVPDPASWFDDGKITFYYPAEREAKSRNGVRKVVPQFEISSRKTKPAGSGGSVKAASKFGGASGI